MKVEEIFGDKAYVGAVFLLLIEMVILIYSGMYMTQRFRDVRNEDTGPLFDRAFKSIAAGQPSASAANFMLVCEQESYSGAISVVRPAVVYIEVKFDPATATTTNTSDGLTFDVARDNSGRRYGSGVVIDRSGYILTNFHVVTDAVLIEVTPFSSTPTKYEASIIRYSQREDLAIIKISAGYNLPEATIGNSSKVEVGDVVVAIGSPFGMEHTATLGIISDERRSVVIDGRLYTEMLQTDAAINTGNSGGALVNIQGEVIGINTAIYAPTGVFAGVGFAIPIERAKALLAETLNVQPQAAAGTPGGAI